MTELELTRTPGDRRLYALGDLGKLRLEGVFSRKATAEAGADRWRFTSHGFWQRGVQATDSMEAVVGEFEPRTFRRGGTLGWAGRELALRPASSWRERYALADGDRELAILDGKSWGRQPVKINVAEPEALEPGLLLFAAFVVRGLASDSDSSTGAASVATTSSG